MMKSDETAAAAVPFSLVPDEIVVQILNKVIDLKTLLCVCKLVSKRFSSIVLQVDTISFTAPPYKYGFPNICYPFESELFQMVMNSVKKFKLLKSLSIEIPSFGPGNGPLIRWKVKLGDNRVDSYVFLSPGLIYNNKGNLLYGKKNDSQQAEAAEEDLRISVNFFWWMCLEDADARFMMLSSPTGDFPLLEKVCVKDSCNRGRVCVSGRAKIDELSKWKNSPPYETFYQRLQSGEKHPGRVSRCCVPLLELPDSGYVMEEVFLYLYLMERHDLPDDGGYASVLNIVEDGIDEDKGAVIDVVFDEAVKEILKKHSGLLERLL